MAQIPSDRRFINLTGKNFGRLTVLEYTGRDHKTRASRWNCKCKCGNIVNIASTALTCKTRKGTESCGCIQKEKAKERATKHGFSGELLYKKYKKMKWRCCNPNCQRFKNYGGRGIFVCKEWSEDYLNFRKWSLENGYREDLTIERIDVNKGYCPENCTWIPMSEQCKNKQSSIKNKK